MPWIRSTLAGAAALILSVAVVIAAETPQAGPQTTPQTPRVVPESRTQVQLSFAPVVKKVTPAVVNVYAQRRVQTQVSPLFDDPVFRKFFGGGNMEGIPRERVESSLGSGVIVDKSGLIVTNFHVIANATEIRIALSDKREFDVSVVLKDEKADLAVLKIRDKGDFPYLELGDSDTIEVGDIVLAIGNPFGVGQTVTQGIVSALARTQVGISDYRFFIQTDAAINPGNSGGALVDLDGKLVGIPSEIYSRSGGSIGIGFAIPVTMVKFILSQAKAGGVVHRPWLGASLQTVTAEVADGLGLKRPGGALVTEVTPGGPAAKAGLKVGDLVSAIDGVEVEDPDGFGYRFSTKPLGTVTKLTVKRDGRDVDLDVQLMTAPEVPPRDERLIATRSPFEGATVDNLSPAVAEELGIQLVATGVVVKSIADGTVADRVGFKKGDLILDVNGVKIVDTKTLARVAASGPDLWRFSVSRGGQVIRMALR
ncbi:MAG: DegQ family serine endoprotease [Ancalomicrobiaceae bacterium]|nr:DegQ family serine endoprotease [Ancalomicrobiaceae bacterium]